MDNWLFVGTLLLLTATNLAWGFRVLPRERWQILAALPGGEPREGGAWQGTNLTWYGLLTANAYLLALALFLILLEALSLSLPRIVLVAALLLGACVPAAGLVARWVEGKAYTLTVGGAVFVGFLLAAPAVWVANLLPVAAPPLPLLPTLAAMAISYGFGEGLGRLACISFGCCYGKPLAQCPDWMQRVFARWNFIFHGDTKKIAYAAGLCGQPVVPVQGLTAVFCCGAAALGLVFYLAGWYAAAFFVSVALTQSWRVLSEVLRADYRGLGRLSAYQWMALALIPLAAVAAGMCDGATGAHPQIARGLLLLWRPEVILLLQGLWLLIFLHTGRSKITGAQLSFHVHHERI